MGEEKECVGGVGVERERGSVEAVRREGVCKGASECRQLVDAWRESKRSRDVKRGAQPSTCHFSRDRHAHGTQTERYLFKKRVACSILLVSLVHRGIRSLLLLLLLGHGLTGSSLLGLGLVDTVGPSKGCSMWGSRTVRSLVSKLLVRYERAGSI